MIALSVWKTPYTGGYEAVLPAGEVFVIANDPPEGATAVGCVPERHEELHAHFVPDDVRSNPKYASYYLCIDLDVIESACRIVSDVR
ncbi:MAG: hypothetical protein JSV86_05365 [Gemmatimonadota bacterium]|nr:MAG: hypothetical protein JSV86_05365 [Gemmatimonadota bacterium]